MAARTQLRPQQVTGRRYGAFAGRAAEAVLTIIRVRQVVGRVGSLSAIVGLLPGVRALRGRAAGLTNMKGET